ncbi:hypothetical protein ACWOD8_08855 [Enterococcus plantarum]|uniref:hypothetical protein n=1 Tax=Enterococcus plantarum TaxID=1077675 RepID=UPI0009F34161|nr:hypothetical protein [Enterococcus plantarum]
MNQITELSEEQLKTLAKEINNLARQDREDEKRRLVSNAYHNTRMLLRNYNKLKKHCEIVDEQVSSELGTLWSDWRFDLDSLLEHKAKTVKLMNHVDRALEAYKILDPIKYDVLANKYFRFNSMSDELIGSKYDVDRRTIKRWEDKGVEDLSIMVFGVDVIFNKL